MSTTGEEQGSTFPTTMKISLFIRMENYNKTLIYSDTSSKFFYEIITLCIFITIFI
jgi:hypothetical protein